MSKDKKLIIFGTGEIGELAHYYFSQDSEFEIVAFSADDEFVKEDNFKGLPVVAFSELKKSYPTDSYSAHVALSYNRLNLNRKEKYIMLKESGYKLASYVCTKSVTWPDLAIGDNCFILENQTIQPTVRIGNNVMIWSGNHIGHGCTIKDHAYISSHVCISGHTEIGERCFLGVNSTFKDFIKVGEAVFVTMGANVVSDIADNSVVIGAQGKTLTADDEAGKRLRTKYFNL